MPVKSGPIRYYAFYYALNIALPFIQASSRLMAKCSAKVIRMRGNCVFLSKLPKKTAGASRQFTKIYNYSNTSNT